MMSTSRNRLLVSVRNLAEAQSALAGGCTILDFKEPAAGSLGKAAPETLHTACTALRETVPGLTLSAALGEALEASARAIHPLPHGLDFVKLGCAGLTRFGSKWSHRWLAASRSSSVFISRSLWA